MKNIVISKPLSCPACDSTIPILKLLLDRNNPIHHFPVMRSCGRCGASLRYEMPRGSVIFFGLAFAAVLALAVVVHSYLGLLPESASRRDVLFPMLAVLPLNVVGMVVYFRGLMRVRLSEVAADLRAK